MGRKEDLEGHIREILDLIKQYEDKHRLSDDPKERRRCERSITEQRDLLRQFQGELANLTERTVSRDVLTGLEAALLVQSPSIPESLALGGLCERMEKMATAIYNKVIDPWSQNTGTGIGEGFGLRLARKRRSAIEGSQGTLIRLARFYRNTSALDKDELWLTARYISDLRSNFEALLYLVQMIPESSATLSAKLRLENSLRTIINMASDLEAELKDAADSERDPNLRLGWQSKIAGVVESLFHQTSLTLTGTYDLLDSVGQS